MTPLRIRKLRLSRASAEDVQWVCGTLNRINASFGARADLMSDCTLTFVLP
jgi:poly-gamma-glutamate capsule biosynthesis protein CapA/YwtB (metallophosphatase superfamily)